MNEFLVDQIQFSPVPPILRFWYQVLKSMDEVEVASQNDRKIPNRHAHLSFNLLLPDS